MYSSESDQSSDKGPIMYSTESDQSSEQGPIESSNKKPPSSYEQEIYGGTSSNRSGSSISTNADILPDGSSLSNPNPWLKRLRKRDPDLFLKNDVGKFASYSTSCQPVSRHPVILTDDEFKKTDPNSYSHSYTYGTDPGKQHHFICPRFWCFLTNRAISEADAIDGKCGGIIPKGAKKIPTGAYVYKLGDKDQVPGFQDNAHPEGYCLPCCTQKGWESKPQLALRQKCAAAITDAPKDKGEAPNKKSVIAKTSQYVISLDTFPIEPSRWGYLPVPIQLFLDVDYMQVVDRNNPALISPNKSTLLRHGVEQVIGQSFLGVFAKLYSLLNQKTPTISVAQFRELLATEIGLDLFAKAQNASLLSFFSQSKAEAVDQPTLDKYAASTRFAKGLDLGNAAQKSYLEAGIRAHKSFTEYLRNPKSKIDHSHLWDFMSMPNSRIIPKGLNIVMMEISTQDMVERVELICPRSLYSGETVFDDKKESVFILKRGEFYEPIFQYESSSAAPIPTFQANTLQANIRYVLKNVEYMMKRSCAPLPSLPRIYTVKPAIPLNAIKQRVAAMADGTKIDKHVIDYSSRVIGALILSSSKDKAVRIFVPCLPAPLESSVAETDVVYMDDESIPVGYQETRDALKRVGAKLGLVATHKIVEDGLIVGLLTDTNQFIPTQPNESVVNDELRTFNGVSHFAADKLMATTDQAAAAQDEHSKRAKNITLESYFYGAFRNKMRALFSKVVHRSLKQQVAELVANPAQIYANKVRKTETLLRTLAEGQVVFVEIDESVLKIIDQSCDDPEDADEPHCIVKGNGDAMQLVLPKRHLITDKDNEIIYFGRLADELVRNERTKRVFFDSAKQLLNPAIETSYSVKPNEFIIVQSALTPEYFSNIDVDRGSRLTNYFTARPSVSALYSVEPVALADQLPTVEPKTAEQQLTGENLADSTMPCVDRVIDPVGNPTTSQWRKYLPKDGVKELVFRDSPECASEMMAKIFKESGHTGVSQEDIISYLAIAYEELLAGAPQLLGKIAESMRKQGKSQMFEQLAKQPGLGSAHLLAKVRDAAYNITDLDIWVLAAHYKLPIILFNPNGLKGFGAKEIQWIKMHGGLESDFFFIRSNIASIANKVYEYNLVVPKLRLNALRDGFKTMVQTAIAESWINVDTVETRLAKIVFISKAQLNAKKVGGSKRATDRAVTKRAKQTKRTKRRGVHYERW